MSIDEESTVVITGASRGIGRVIAEVFAVETDHPLLLISRSMQDLQETKERCTAAGAARVNCISCDLTDSQAVAAITLPEDFPSPGMLINNAGSYLFKPLQLTSHDEFIQQLQANIMSAVHMTNRLLDKMKGVDYGLIINICSAGALEGLPDSGAYASAKHGLLGYARSLRQELLDTHVGVTAINLGQTQSTSWKGSEVDPARLIDPRDVAHLLVALTGMSKRTVADEIILTPQHGRVPPM